MDQMGSNGVRRLATLFYQCWFDSVLFHTGINMEHTILMNKLSPLPRSPETVPRYTAYRTSNAPELDGRLFSSCWQHAPRSSRFVDLVDAGETLHDTRAAVLWDEHSTTLRRCLANGLFTLQSIQTSSSQHRFIWMGMECFADH